MKFLLFTGPLLGDWVLESLETRGKLPLGIVLCEEMMEHSQTIRQKADQYNIPLFCVGQDLSGDTFVRWCRSFNADVFVAFSFSRKITPEILSIPPFGMLNVHPSLLPRYRGASPCFWAIKNGEMESGVTVHFMDESFDTGDIVLQKREPIHPNDTAGTLQQRLMLKGAEILIDVLENSPTSLQLRRRQEQREIYEAPWVKPEHLEIAWRQPAVEIERLIRAANPYPVAKTMFEGRQIGIIEADVLEKDHSLPPGEFYLGGDVLIVGTGKGILKARVLQFAQIGFGAAAHMFSKFPRGVFGQRNATHESAAAVAIEKPEINEGMRHECF